MKNILIYDTISKNLNAGGVLMDNEKIFKDELKICASKITNIIACSYGITLSERNLRNWIHPNKSIQKSQYENGITVHARWSIFL